MKPEPVAYLYEHPTNPDDWRLERHLQPQEILRAGWTETPLYTRPAPAADEALVEVEAALKEYLGKQCGMVLQKHALTGLARAVILALKEQHNG